MLRRLFQQSSIYAIASVTSKLSGFILLAYYGDPEILAKADFGYLGALDATKMFALLVAGLGLPLGILRFASSPTLSEGQRAAVPMTALSVAVVAGAVAAALGWALAPLASELIFGTAARAHAVRWLAVYIGIKTVSDVSYTVLRQREKAAAFVLVGVVEALLLVAFVVWFLVRGEGLVGVMKGYAASAAVVAVVVTPMLIARVDRTVDRGLIGPMLAFGAPLIASGFAARFLNLGDRFLVLHFLGAEGAAVYEWAARFGGVVNSFLVQSFVLAFTVLGMKSLDETGSPELHRQAFRHFAALAGWVTLGLGLFVSDVSRLLTDDPEFIGTADVVMLVAGGFAFYGLYFVVVNVLYTAGRTRAVAVSVGASAILNLALNVVLIPVMGIAGAAVATLVAYAALALLTARLAQASAPVAYPWRSLVAIGALAAGLYVVGRPVEGWETVPRLAARVALAAAYVPGLFALGVYRRDDLARAVGLVTRRDREAKG
ncbi:polysaccharide biosynthesis C-terminal domain-containing protein [Rubrivirga sp. IMCC45206]|uniref:oligosaccharide flippase family protein n=1 Tax=Rubrivirga sp. IMCC45206 TaxID=3391614 RepID=UPI00398FC605